MSIYIHGHVKTLLFLFGLVLLVFSPISYSHSYQITNDHLTDFHLHKLFAISLAENGPDSLPPFVLAHSGWEVLLVSLNKFVNVSFEFASFLGALLSFELTALILFFWYQPVFSKPDGKSWPIWLVILGVSIAAPVSLLWSLDRLMYLGYIGITSYHNPTIILLKPFAILQFIFAFECFRGTFVFKNWQIFLAALISSLSTFIKPSLAISILPALIVFIAYRILTKQSVNYRALFWGLGLPTMIVLVWQYAWTYYADKTGGIEFLPLVVMSGYSQHLGWKLLLSILFPLTLLITYFNQAIKDTRIILGWLIFLFGLIFTYLFAETGPRMMDGNFGWSGEIASILLFAVSTLFFLEISPKTERPAKLLTIFWSLHVIFGVLYYLHSLFYGIYY